ncbi:NAD(P)H-binding protein [Salinimicrobium sp. CDJ15-91]|uniref:NAD(P)H-binding protein n=2 Tax=Salinimicrobium oceani TaxID=2722702 RepID=A0ABX1CVE1_9FLAO|nr:NAD(P)H-binding protein [Salinimicrobium oceani]
MLIAEGILVRGSTTSQEKVPMLESSGIEAFVIKVAAEGISGEIERFLEASEVLIVDFPPGLRKDPKLDYEGAIARLAEAVETSGVKKVIFVSSIAVYEETENFSIYTEDAEPNATSASGKQIISAEKILLQNPFFDTTVIRFGGLIGAGRHPVKYLAGRSGLPNPLGPVNLIHLDDCLGILKKVLKNDIFGTVYNAVYPLHPPRAKYYTEKAKEAGLEIPQFDETSASAGKIISASKVVRELGVRFQSEI